MRKLQLSWNTRKNTDVDTSTRKHLICTYIFTNTTHLLYKIHILDITHKLYMRLLFFTFDTKPDSLCCPGNGGIPRGIPYLQTG